MILRLFFLLAPVALSGAFFFSSCTRCRECSPCPTPHCPTPTCPRHACTALKRPPRPTCPRKICPQKSCPKPRCPRPKCQRQECPARKCRRPKCRKRSCPVPRCPVPVCPPLQCPVCYVQPQILECEPEEIPTCPPANCPECPPCPTCPPTDTQPLPGYATAPSLGSFKIYKHKKTWLDARETCSEDGGYLAIANTPGELRHLQWMMEKQHIDTLHVGVLGNMTHNSNPPASDIEPSSPGQEFPDVNGEIEDESSETQPTDDISESSQEEGTSMQKVGVCASLSRKTGQITVESCYNLKYFVCEIPRT